LTFELSERAKRCSLQCIIVIARPDPPNRVFWSYVGRAQYLTEQFPQAWQSLERALSGDRYENIARLYLGSTLIQEGDRQRGLEEIESGMRGSPVFSITLSNPGI
jgi:predicted Zn-dependent protease